MFRRNLLQVTIPDGSMIDDLTAIGLASHSLGVHMYAALAASFSAGTIFNYLAVFAAAYLFILDRTNWRTNILTALLVPYILLNFPDLLLYYVRSDAGHWVAFILLVLRLFFPKNFPEHGDLPAALLLLLITTPTVLVAARFSLVGECISVAIGFYLLYEHILSAGGVRKAFAERGVPITIGILLLFINPAWHISKHFS